MAVSNEWWIYVRRIGGKVVFNAARYSVTTSGHQNRMRDLLEALGVKIDLEIEMPEGLQHFEERAINTIDSRLTELKASASKGRGRAQEARLAEISTLERNRAVVGRILKNLEKPSTESVYAPSERLAA